MSTATAHPSRAPGARLEPGAIVAERYRVDALVGEGGMGSVYRATHVHMRKHLALKVLLPQWTSTSEVIERFAQEAVAAGRIAHPNVAAATDCGQLADGSFFLVLEYVQGRTLRAEVAKGAMDPARALRIVRGIACGVAAAHALGIVHRDLKPENVMLVDRDGDPDFPKVLDFGIAKVQDAAPRATGPLTHAGAILGTPDYMAPEQALGGAVDARADLYAIGVMLYELLTGATPFRGGAATLLRQHVLHEVPTLPPESARGAPASARALVSRLMQKEADQRLPDAEALIATIDGALAELARVPVLERAPTTFAERVSAPFSSPAAASLRGWATASARQALETPRARSRLLIVGLAGAIVLAAVVVRSAGGSAGGGLGSSANPATTAPEADDELPTTEPAPLPPPPSPRELARGASPAPSASGAPSGKGESLPPPPAPSTASKKRRTGPGGIYIPPPSQWFR
ncbi:MAG TPA: serine/threonine-protein kinase [Polyangiaceae bacterium]